MGWTYTHRDKGLSNREFFAHEFGYDSAGPYEILFDTTIENVFYAAMRTKADGEVWALVVLLHRVPRDYHNFGWKGMSDASGPGANKAPVKLLDLLSPTDSQYAIEWRQACRDYAAKKAAAPKIKPGMTIKVPTPFDFTSGASEDTFTYVGRRSVFKTTTGSLVRLPADWRVMDFELV